MKAGVRARVPKAVLFDFPVRPKSIPVVSAEGRKHTSEARKILDGVAKDLRVAKKKKGPQAVEMSVEGRGILHKQLPIAGVKKKRKEK